MYYGELLKKTRTEANLSQEEVAEIFKCTRSVISKLENNHLDIKATRMIQWFAVTNRMDIFALLVKGMEPEEILKVAFTKKYLEGISAIKFPTYEQVKENFKNDTRINNVMQ